MAQGVLAHIPIYTGNVKDGTYGEMVLVLVVGLLVAQTCTHVVSVC